MAIETQEPAPTNQRSNKRNVLVCSRCHEKKIKCDLQSRAAQGSQQCQNCVSSNSPCLLRPSRRGGGKRQAQPRRTTLAGPSEQITHGNTELPVQGSRGATGGPQNSMQIYNNSIPTLSQSARDGVPSNNWPRMPEPSHPASRQTQYGSTRNGSLNAAGQSQDANADRSIVTPGQESLSPQQHQQASYLGDTRYMQIFSRESGGEESISPEQMSMERTSVKDAIPLALQDSYIDTYFEYAYVWCPVLDRESLQHPEVADSPLLRHALALCGNQIKPPLMHHADSVVHYNRAKSLFYAGYESNPIIRISSLMLFYWWSAEPPNVVSMDTNWWWTGVAIRLAQEIGLHREPQPGQLMRPGETPGLRRRIWWTLFARERITAISQGRPCIIDTDYCDVRMLTVEDYPNTNNHSADGFINFIRLCAIIGHIGKRLCRKVDGPTSTVALAKDLINWVQSLPNNLQLPISSNRTISFSREVHGLHLVYLSTITLLHLSKSEKPLPNASIPAIVAASCIARIFEDYLGRGSVRFLAGQAGWYITVAILALLHARRVEGLAAHADADIRTLRTALKQMAILWHSAKMFDLGFDKLLGSESTPIHFPQNPLSNGDLGQPPTSPTLAEPATSDGVNWMDYFPFVTAQTSPLIGTLLANNLAMPFSELEWPMDITSQLHDFFVRPDDFNFDLFTL